MKKFIESLISVSEDIIIQLINKTMEKEKVSFEKYVELEDGLSVITSIRSRINSFQIIINFSEELAKNISSLVSGGVPIVLVDNQVKEVVMEISKLIISNGMIYLEDYDESCLPSPVCLIEFKNIRFNSDEFVTTLRFKLINEPLTIVIITDAQNEKNI